MKLHSVMSLWNPGHNVLSLPDMKIMFCMNLRNNEFLAKNSREAKMLGMMSALLGITPMY